MQYIDRVIIHNFKSFKHANIKFDKGFNCIVGPNGSGKSNVCDSLLFALGEQSLKRMRISSTSQLITDKIKKNEDAHIYVKVVFGGDKNIEVTREINGDRMTYILNGKRSTRQMVIDSLRENSCEINETNTITQGEIAELLSLNPKEKRALIDVAAGIREFDIKKAESLKELEKVENKIGNSEAILNERLGFLEELAKEREQAEKYIQANNAIKQINYTLLKLREELLTKEYEKKAGEYIKDIEIKTAIERKIGEIESQMQKLMDEKEAFSKKLNERSIDANTNNRILEQVNKTIAVNESKIEAIRRDKKNEEERIKRLSEEREKLNQKHQGNDMSITELTNSLRDIGEIQEEQDVTYVETLSAEYKTSQENIELLKLKLDSFEKDYSQIMFDLNSIEKDINSLKDSIKLLKTQSAEKESFSNLTKKSLDDAKNKITKKLDELKVFELKLKKLDEEANKWQVERINFKEQLSLSGNSDKIAKFLNANIKEGFYGRAEDLCSYDEKYALAVYASASSRLNYFIVDSIDIADIAIKLLKNNNLGRASFIPLKSLNVKETGTGKNNDEDELLSHLKFDNKFRKAFQFIFFNTYIINDIQESKKLGIGHRRYVTLNGELIETSGIITGGNIKLNPSFKNIELKLNNANANLERINNEMSITRKSLEESRKELSEYESMRLKLDFELNYSIKETAKINSDISNSDNLLVNKINKLEDLKKLLKKISEEKEDVLSKLNEEKETNNRLYHRLTKSLLESHGKMSAEEIEKTKMAREQKESKKIKIAEITKENQMLNDRINDIIREINDLNINIEKSKSDENDIILETANLRKNMLELQEKMAHYDAETQEVYAQLKRYESEMSTISMEKGKLLNNLERLNKEIFDVEATKVQLEVRIGDIKSELIQYTEMPLVKGDVQTLEGELAKKRLELEGIGMVNMKAPEIYEQKKAEVDEAQQRMSILQNEKASILEMINQIESRKLDIFTETLESVNKNFKELYKHIFTGEASLVVDNIKDTFNSGLSIDITIDNKHKPMERFSGGEKSLMMLMLIFAIQMRKPMSFYIFDEIDASLDKENSKKLSLLISELSKKSQFIVVSHNDSMVTSSVTGIGITKQDYESRAVGIMLSEKNSI
ncbi:chromosome segregation protein SMC [Candidatus Marsarchaeota archaeon]|nr:chromosome segregation protein SMC [Candidatus Marsarchaeota archaeon]